jgi:peroxiredoxin
VDLKQARGKGIHVLVFWDSGCSACQTATPELTRLQDRFQSQGVVLACITPESADALQSFIQGMRGRLNFALATDENGKTHQAYMGAFGKVALPHAFVINKRGVIAWQGHPLGGLERVLDEMVTDSFDIERAKRAANAEKLQAEYFAAVSMSETNTSSNAAALGNRILTDGSSNPWLLNNFAYRILADPRVKNRDLALALKAAKTALNARGGKEPAFLDTYARALFDTGKTAEAVEAQKQAIALCTDQTRRNVYEQSLRNYEQRIKN